jgi:hypothetical protein
MNLKALGEGGGREGGRGRRGSRIGKTAGTTLVVGLLVMVRKRGVQRVTEVEVARPDVEQGLDGGNGFGLMQKTVNHKGHQKLQSQMTNII